MDFRHSRSRALGFEALLVSLLVLAVFMMALRPMTDPDIYWHLRNAGYFVQTHHWIRADMFAFTTAGAPWIDHEWLAELPFYAAFRLAGTGGLFAVTALLLEIIFLGVYVLARQASGNAKAAWLVTLAAVMLGTVSFGPRTLLFGWVCLVLELLVLARFEAKRTDTEAGRLLWLLPPLFLAWVNLHGSWLMGMAVLAAYIACGLFRVRLGAIQSDAWQPRERKLLAIAFVCCMAALFANPYGWRLVAYPFDLAFKQTLNITYVQEWQPLDSHTPRARVLLAFLAFGFVAQLARQRRWKLHELAFFFIGICAGVTYTRFLFLTGILALPLLARDIPWRTAATRTQDHPVLHAALICLMVFTGARMYRLRSPAVYGTQGYPAQALPFLKTFQPRGRVFNSYLWGGYLELYAPNIPTFIDSRVDIFERRGIFKDYLDVLDLKNSLQILDKDGIRYVLFERDSALAYFLKQVPAWKIDYQDETTVLFECTTAANRHAD